jgi:hypothetical protein
MHNFDSLGYLQNEIFEKFTINNFSLLKDNLFLRSIKYNNIEILKLISFLVRDKNWNNYSPEIIKTSSYNKDKKLHFEFDLKYGDVEQLEVKLLLSIGGNSVKLIANGKFLTDFWTNRIGFNLLLPLDGVVNQQVTVSKSDHTTETLKYPLIIQPDQPMVKFNNLSYEMFDLIDLNIRFDGIHFEMEDQRNWGDASYKIYSGSLLDPFPYKENKNSDFHQEIEITMREKNNSLVTTSNQNILPNNIKEEYTMPKIGIKVDNDINGIDLVNVDFLYHLVDFENNTESSKPRFNHLPIYLVALIDHSKKVEVIIKDIKDHIDANKINVNKLLICPKIYLNSFQPAGEWPSVPKLGDYYKEAKNQFPDVQIFSGMVTNFTELNRKKPDGDFDGINFSFTPIVHDASDYGVLDTPNSIKFILHSINNFTKDTPIHIGPMTLGMHFNPYGEKLAPNIDKVRLEMTDLDPRHDSLISLNWTIAVFSEILLKNTKFITIASLKGIHGILTENNQKRPLFHLYEVFLYFKNAKIYKIEKKNSISGVKLVKEEKMYYLLTNNSSNQTSYILENETVLQQSYLNKNNFEQVSKSQFSFLNFEDSTKSLSFEPYEIKLIQVS